jgi:hypothetical protein
METEQQAPEPVREESQMENEPVLPVPEDDRPAEEWADRANRAVAARELGQRLRKGKRVLFPSMRSLSNR